MRKLMALSLGLSMGVQAGGPVCLPDASTTFTDVVNKAYTVTHDSLGNNALYSQCTNMSDQQFISDLDLCGILANPINGLGMSPVDQFLYGLMPTDDLGIGTHLELTIPFPSPGKPGDMMKADPVDIYRIGNDGGYERIGEVLPPTEDSPLPPDTDQVIPLVHSAASFNELGDLFVLGYKTNYTSSADVMAGTGQVIYQTPRIMIGQIMSASLTAAAGGTIPAVWFEADTSTDPVCSDVMNAFRDRTNVFSDCVVADFITNGDPDAALQSCLNSTNVLGYGIHDFAVSPLNGNYYALDSQTYDDRDVLIEVDSATMIASCTEYADAGNATGLLTSLMFSQQNKLVAVFANENTGRWIDVNTGVITTLADTIVASPFGDGSSMPFVVPRVMRFLGIVGEIIFKNGFEPDLIFYNGFEGTPPTCPVF
ncbi:hypothetical protein ACFODZ_01770 [Marinicella sediminis]|uniref:Uncharacterized protein n=1 Tax=Marinicella sediminis TaxID=1792834 RepID=A0ABV7J7P6_9GAMM|nr:hypothetical protein [Marinicella sediminis]